MLIQLIKPFLRHPVLASWADQSKAKHFGGLSSTGIFSTRAWCRTVRGRRLALLHEAGFAAVELADI